MKNLLIALTLMVATTAQAEDNFFRPYVGVFTGFNHLQGQGTEANKNGYNLGVKGTGSYFTDNFIFDAQLGWQHNTMNGTSNNTDVTIKTWSIFLDLDAKYRLSQNWSFGPEIQTHFGTDHTYAESLNSNTVTTLAGLTLAYDTKIGSMPFRVDAGALTNVAGGDSRRNVVMNVGVSIGFDDLFGSKKETSYPRPVAVRAAPPVQKSDDGDVKITLKFARVNFDTDIFVLDNEAKGKLEKLGKWLKANPNRFGRLKISGHTDTQGAKEYNQRLSQDRADSVLKVFIGAGVPENKMQAVGYGYSRPVDPRETVEAREKNRRTEIEFFDVKDRTSFNKVLLEILK